MQKIVPHLWFDTEAKEAATFYTEAFGGSSKVHRIETIHDTPSGDADIVSFELLGFPFQAISAGPYFKPNPSISFMVNFDPSRDPEARTKMDALWSKLTDGGKVLMELGEYPFSKHYGWVEDKYGFSWQLILTNPEGEPRPAIVPSLLFVGDNCGKAEEATDLYLSVFKDAKRGALVRYSAGAEPDKEGTVMFTDFMLEKVWFAAMDSAHQHKFAFNEAISFLVYCEDQEELDYYTEKLSAVPESEQCGWIKDAYGVSWQITPTILEKLMRDEDPAKAQRVTDAMLKMKRINIAELEAAADDKA